MASKNLSLSEQAFRLFKMAEEGPHQKLAQQAHRASADADDVSDKINMGQLGHEHAQDAHEKHLVAHEKHMDAARALMRAGQPSTAGSHQSLATKHMQKAIMMAKVHARSTRDADRAKASNEERLQQTPLLGSGRHSPASARAHLEAAGFETGWLSEQRRLLQTGMSTPSLMEAREQVRALLNEGRSANTEVNESTHDHKEISKHLPVVSKETSSASRKAAELSKKALDSGSESDHKDAAAAHLSASHGLPHPTHGELTLGGRHYRLYTAHKSIANNDTPPTHVRGGRYGQDEARGFDTVKKVAKAGLKNVAGEFGDAMKSAGAIGQALAKKSPGGVVKAVKGLKPVGSRTAQNLQKFAASEAVRIQPRSGTSRDQAAALVKKSSVAGKLRPGQTVRNFKGHGLDRTEQAFAEAPAKRDVPKSVVKQARAIEKVRGIKKRPGGAQTKPGIAYAIAWKSYCKKNPGSAHCSGKHEDARSDTLARLAKKHGPESNPKKSATLSTLGKLRSKYGKESRETREDVGQARAATLSKLNKKFATKDAAHDTLKKLRGKYGAEAREALEMRAAGFLNKRGR